MKKPTDPVRLLEDPATPARLSEALRLARATPDTTSVARLSGALGVPVPPAPPVVPPASGLVATSGGTSLGFLGVSGAVTLGLGAAALALSSTRTSVPPAPARPVTASVATEASRVPNAVPEATGEPPPSTPAPPPRKRRAESEAVPPAAEPAPPVVEAQAEPTDAASRLREEALLVRNAERLLASDPAGALRQTDERRRRFPGGALGQEAEVVAIDALLRLGRREAALKRARAFEATHKDSLYARRIHALVGSP